MNTRKFLSLFAFFSLASVLACAPVMAKPILTPHAGSTTVKVSSAFGSALRTLGVSLGTQFPAHLRGNTARFPISSGQIDLDGFKGEIGHLGSLTLSSGDMTVELSDFVIDTTGKCPVITGLVSINQSIVARVPLFNLNLTRQPQVRNFGLVGSIRIRDVAVTLSSKAATTLNLAFGTTALNSEIPVGTASVRAYTYDPSSGF